MTAADAERRIRRDGIIAIIRGDFAREQVLRVVEALVAQVITVVEVALNSSQALDLIAEIARAFADAALVGAGTVCSSAALDNAFAAGAHFAVAPNYDRETAERARAQDRLYLPGVLTPTESAVARAGGCHLQKLFPAQPLGPGYLTAIRAPLDDVDFVPTGGITADNVADYARAGAVAVGVGSPLVGAPDRPAEDLAARAARLRAAWDGAR